MPSRKQQLEAYQKRMNQSTSSVNAVKTPTKFRSSFKAGLKGMLSPSSKAPPSSPTASCCEESIHLDARNDDESSSSVMMHASMNDIGKVYEERNRVTTRRMSAPGPVIAKKSDIAVISKEKTKAPTTSEKNTKKTRRATASTVSTTKEPTASKPTPGKTRRASHPVVSTAPTVELSDFVQLDKDKRRETLTTLDPAQVELLFVESSRKLLSKKTLLQKQLTELQEQHASETRRLQEQLVDANVRLKQRELVHAQRQADHQSKHQNEHVRLHQAMTAARSTFEQQTTELETKTMTLVEQVAEMKYKVEHVDEYIKEAEDATYFSFQVLALLAVGVAAVWAPACVCEPGMVQSSLTNLPFMWAYGA